jgi:hypothetical protein
LFGTARKNETNTDAISIESIFAYRPQLLSQPDHGKGIMLIANNESAGWNRVNAPFQPENRSLV